MAGQIDRVATQVQCPKCKAWIDFPQALATRKCSECGARLPRTGDLKIKHSYVPRTET